MMIGVAGMGCLLALLLSKRGKIGGAEELMHEGMDHFHNAIDSARRKMREAAETASPKAQALAADVSGRVRRWVGKRLG